MPPHHGEGPGISATLLGHFMLTKRTMLASVSVSEELLPWLPVAAFAQLCKLHTSRYGHADCKTAKKERPPPSVEERTQSRKPASACSRLCAARPRSSPGAAGTASASKAAKRLFSRKARA